MFQCFRMGPAIASVAIAISAISVTVGRAEPPTPPSRAEPANASPALLPPGRNVLFLGDSITQAGTYVALIETYLWARFPDQDHRLINLGLSSETASGLSEPDHPFPRPCIHDRLDRVIAQAKPDVTFVCYGMNDGIYHPPSPRRRSAYRDGLQRLIRKLRDAGSRVVLITPPPFDAATVRLRGQELTGRGTGPYGYKRPFADYDEVLREYGQWVLAPKPGVELAIDVHAPLKAYIAEQRSDDPMFQYGDGIHPGLGGHLVLAQTILRELGAPGVDATLGAPGVDATLDAGSVAADSPLLGPAWELALRRHRLLSAAWREQVGHANPGKSDAPPLAEAQRQADEMEAEIRRLLP